VTDQFICDLFRLDSRVAIVTGGTGTLGSVMATALARAGAKVGILGRRLDRAEKMVREIADLGEAMALPADVLNQGELEAARDMVLERWGRIDILVNAAGGNVPAATVDTQQPFFGLSLEAFEQAVDLNLLGTLLPCQVFGATMAGQDGQGCIVNISSMSARRALTRVVAYGAAKAAVENLTRWLAVELARSYGPGLRVNAIAPGFFVGQQNRDLLLKPDGALTERGRAIIEHTPAGRFGEPNDLIGTLIWLCSDAARYVNGVIVPVDGGFSAFSGV
jgi:NAD(P)-dependent dehydrogenase (short-subunit alcohol dehydrogenase family)